MKQIIDLPGLVDEGRAADTFYQDCSKAFDTASHKIFIEELLLQGTNKQTVRWTESWPDSEAESVRQMPETSSGAQGSVLDPVYDLH